MLTAPYNGMVPLLSESTNPSMPLAWVRRGDLSNVDVRHRVADELGRGAVILVTGPGDETGGEAATFGFEASGAISAYRRSQDGSLDVKTVDEDLAFDEVEAAFNEWLERGRMAAPRIGRARAATAAASDAPGDGGYVPRVEIHQDKSFKGGRAIRHHIVVVRDIEASRDQKVVMVTTEVDQASEKNGAVWNGKFQPDGKGYALFVPNRYVVTTQLAGVGQAVRLGVQEFEPKSDGAIERAINETVSVKTSYGASATFDVLEGLEKNSAPHLGKIALGFNYGKERTEQLSVSMTLKDYFVEASTREGNEGSRAVTWAFSLAPDIARNVSYFEDGDGLQGPLNSTGRMTPMMRRATLQTASVWRLPGAYEGWLDVITRADVDVRIYDSLEQTSEAGPDREATISFLSRINLGSAYLTRQPTVRLQSLHGLGACLSQHDPEALDVVMETCGKGPGGEAQQWYLEADNTYRNRGSRQCLTTDPSSGIVHAAACSGTPLNQQWHWSADRLQSLYEGGNRWRLHVRDGIPGARFDPKRHQEIVSNQYHALLRPWSSYPNKPSKGDVIPNLAGSSPQIPESYLQYSAVTVEERWQPLPVRTGL
ncbi:RICIN domain-containing protein [Luteibacter sp.]|uniref:RICIN domain-containing protein n=1 Tax=Luteibacter sp. TaxID=1886636 RepID=UPI002F40E9F9